MTTKHSHPMVFGKREADCPRCAELNAGAPVVKWSGTLRREDEARTVAAIRAHRCDVSKCGPVCTRFDW